MKSLKHLILLSATLLFITQIGYTQGDDPEPTIVSIGVSNTINCLSASQNIGVSVNGWVSGFDYQWNTGENDSIISVKPLQTTTYFLQITHPTLGISELRGFEIKVENDPIKAFESSYIRDNKTCLGTELNIEPEFYGGYAPYTFTWDNGLESRTQLIHPQSNSNHLVSISDACNSLATASISVEVEKHEPINPASAKTYEFDCVNEFVGVKPNMSEVSGGVGSGYQYSFDNWTTQNEPLSIAAQDGEIIEVHFTDACGYQIASSEIELVQRTLVQPVLESIIACENQVVDITSSILEESFFYWDGNVMTPEYNFQVTKSEDVTLTYLDICGDAQRINREIVMSEVESEFDFDAHESTGTVDLFTVNSKVGETYEWKVNGDIVGTATSLELTMDAGSTNVVELTTMNKNRCIAINSRSVSVRDNYSVPSAFSPNNDGKNDFFRLNIDEEFTQFNINIFDRWGQLIYHSNNPYFAWKGEDQTTGILNTYVYKLTGTIIGGGSVNITGAITVVN